jgi:N6-adenosine-specific RNA methylase IME4
MSALPRVLMADAPWTFNDSLPGGTRGASKNYRTLSFEEIRDFPIPEVEADAWLFFWRVSSMVEEAYAVVRAWGFEPKSEIVWVKTTGNADPEEPLDVTDLPLGAKLHFGMGRSVRAAHETCVIAKKGHPALRSASVRSVFFAPVGRHSAKPACFYGLVEQLAFGPYHELFARTRRPGWTAQGDELPPAP